MGSFEKGNETLGSIEFWEIIEWLSKLYCPLKKDYAVWSE
jgi:hypothetical protein